MAVRSNTSDDVNKIIDNNVVKYNWDSTIDTRSNDNNNDDEREVDEVIVKYIHRTQLTNAHSLQPTQVQKEEK